ncbi:hypothetical protein, partial [Bowmanella pacifica]|uniref:hypothetical protein n=1 Tax=Bowmanella pacifica TaxID=502051 RepID=UPI001E2EB30E
RCLPFLESFCLPGLAGYPVEVVRILQFDRNRSSAFCKKLSVRADIEQNLLNKLVKAHSTSP